MSDTSGGPGWWLASDGRFYPPGQSPGPTVPITAPSPGWDSAPTVPPVAGSWETSAGALSPGVTSTPAYLSQGNGPRPERPPAQKFIVGAVVVIFIAVIAIFAIGALNAKPLNQSATTTGTVLSCGQVSGQGQENVVRYQVDSRSYTTMAWQRHLLICPYAVGQTVTVHYNPLDPISASVPQPGASFPFLVIVGVIGAAGLLMSTIVLVRIRRRA